MNVSLKTSLIADCLPSTGYYVTCSAVLLLSLLAILSQLLPRAHTSTRVLPISPWLDVLLSLASPISTHYQRNHDQKRFKMSEMAADGHALTIQVRLSLYFILAQVSQTALK